MIDAGIYLDAVLSDQPVPAFLEAMGKFGATAAKNDVPIFGGAMSLDQIPMLLQTGSLVICVQFDVWAFSRMLEASLNAAKTHVKQFEGNPSASVPNGHGKPE
jgi:4-hydroxy-2-oxoheptanedioate aldolase